MTYFVLKINKTVVFLMAMNQKRLFTNKTTLLKKITLGKNCLWAKTDHLPHGLFIRDSLKWEALIGGTDFGNLHPIQV